MTQLARTKRALSTTVRVLSSYAEGCERNGLIVRRLPEAGCEIELNVDPFDSRPEIQAVLGKIPEQGIHHVVIRFELESGDIQIGKYPWNIGWKAVWIWEKDVERGANGASWRDRLFGRRPNGDGATKKVVKVVYIRAICIQEAVRMFEAVERGELQPCPLYE